MGGGGVRQPPKNGSWFDKDSRGSLENCQSSGTTRRLCPATVRQPAPQTRTHHHAKGGRGRRAVSRRALQ